MLRISALNQSGWETRAAKHWFSQDQCRLQSRRLLVLPHRRQVFVDGRAVEIGSRAFDVLSVLIAARGEVVSKDTILSRVWPKLVVEENALHAQISALRKALGEHREHLKTVAGRGYQFSGDAAIVERPPPVEDKAVFLPGKPAPAQSELGALPLTNLGAPTSELIGRGADLEQVSALVVTHRLVTLTGAGGVGKTRLAQEVARHLLAGYPDGIWIVDLEAVSDPDLVRDTVAAVLASGGREAGPADSAAKAIAGKRMLVLLDNCEHLIDAVAHLAELLLQSRPAVHVLATSREPLRVPGELVYRVSPLALPEEHARGLDVLLQSGAVQLFVERARGADTSFPVDGPTGATIAAICRRLDGIPLAIELAAARAVALGVEGVALRLDDALGVLTGGHRTAPPRHRTLRATLDWSYAGLTKREGDVLRCLSAFAGTFTLEAASAVASVNTPDVDDLVDCVSNLVMKSLVTVDVSVATAVYRLLKTTRAYALEKLIESGEFETIARRHAEYCRSVHERMLGVNVSDIKGRPYVSLASSGN